jgi:hypothetical protein
MSHPLWSPVGSPVEEASESRARVQARVAAANAHAANFSVSDLGAPERSAVQQGRKLTSPLRQIAVVHAGTAQAGPAAGDMEP